MKWSNYEQQTLKEVQTELQHLLTLEVKAKELSSPKQKWIFETRGAKYQAHTNPKAEKGVETENFRYDETEARTRRLSTRPDN